MYEKWKETNAAAEEADEISRTCAGELAGSEEHTGVPGGGQQNIAEEDRRETEDQEAVKRRNLKEDTKWKYILEV